ncbi:helix-turn-helix domain-containing protein [Inquilinus limosus]|uniref:helix-turn-helix domain-containing protein n=1 Tax=Inquilinus limosus TaxID=171674 RepID=UPI0012698DB4|nr:helix-turn-helix transcriptional regulator [Inquilinus limosus]
MSTSEAIEARNLAMAAAYLDGGSVSQVAKQFHLSYAYVHALLKRLDVLNHPDRKAATPARKAFAERRPLSNFHSTIGARLGYYRVQVKGLEYATLSQLTGIPAMRLSAAENGIVDLTISDLVKLSKILEFKLEDIMLPLGERTVCPKAA